MRNGSKEAKMQGGKDRTVVARRHALGILALLGCASLALAAEGRPAASQQSNASTAPEQAAPAGAPSIAPDAEIDGTLLLRAWAREL